MWSNSFEHDFVEDESAAEQTLSPPKLLDDGRLNPEKEIVWNAKVHWSIGEFVIKVHIKCAFQSCVTLYG